MSETLEKFGKASANNKKSEATTVKTARQPGESVLSCFDLSSFSTTHPVFFVTYKKIPDPDNAKEVKIINETSWQAKVNPDNNTLTNLTLAPGYTDIGNEVGDCVECIPTAFWANSLIDGLNNSLDNNGKIKPEAVPNVTAAIKEKSITADKIDFTTMPGNKYSTEEQDTGHKWIDGRPIYRKVVRGTVNMTGNSTSRLAHGIQGLTSRWELIKYYGNMRLGGTLSNNLTKQALPYVENTHQSGIASIDDTSVTISGSYPWGNSEVSIVLEYVK